MGILLIFLSALWGIYAWRDPRRAVLWFPIFLPSYVLRTSVAGLPTTLLELAFAALLIGVTARVGMPIWREGWRRIRPWLPAIALWIIATVVSVLIAPDRIAALGLWRAYVLEPLVFFALLAATVKTDNDRRETVNALALTTVVLFVWAVVQFAFNIGIPHPWNADILHRRATGPYPFPNALALFAAPVAVLCFGLLVASSKQQAARIPGRWSSLATCYLLLAAGFIAGIGATLLAKSVGGSLAIFVSVSLALLLDKRTRKAAVIALAILFIAVFSIPSLRYPVTHALTFQEWSGKVRLIIWGETANMLKDRPLTGAGFGAYPEVIKPYHKATFIEIFQYPHNILLNLWSETGLLGVAAFFWICVTWIRELKGKSQKSLLSTFDFRLSTLLPLLAILIHGLVDVPYFKNDLAFLFWTLAALATGHRATQNRP